METFCGSVMICCRSEPMIWLSAAEEWMVGVTDFRVADPCLILMSSGEGCYICWGDFSKSSCDVMGWIISYIKIINNSNFFLLNYTNYI